MNNFTRNKLFISTLFILSLLTLFCVGCSNSNDIKPLNQNAKNYKISSETGAYMFYTLGKNFFTENEHALELTFSSVNQKTEITVGFLYDSDFKGRKLISYLPSRNVCHVALSENATKSIVSFAFVPELKDSIKGFLVYSDKPLTLENMRCVRKIPKSCGGDDKYNNILSSLLEKIVIAEDLNSATSIAKKYSYRFKIVTLDGQVVNAGGSLTGGSLNRNTGLLSRASEIEQLKIGNIVPDTKKLLQFFCEKMGQILPGKIIYVPKM